MWEVREVQKDLSPLSLDLLELLLLLFDLSGVQLARREQVVDRFPVPLGTSNLLAQLLSRTSRVLEDRKNLASLGVQPLEPQQVPVKVRSSVLEPFLDIGEMLSQERGIKHTELGILDAGFGSRVPSHGLQVPGLGDLSDILDPASCILGPVSWPNRAS